MLDNKDNEQEEQISMINRSTLEMKEKLFKALDRITDCKYSTPSVDKFTEALDEVTEKIDKDVNSYADKFDIKIESK